MKKHLLKILLIWMLCFSLIAVSAKLGVSADGLPTVGPGLTDEEDGEGDTEAADSTESTLPAVGPSITEADIPDGSEENDAEDSGGAGDPDLEAETTAEEASADSSVIRILNTQTTDTTQALTVNTDNGATVSDAASIQQGVLTARRLQKLAESSEFTTIIFRGSKYVNIRSEATTNSSIVGKMHYNAVATILDTVYTENGLWYHITSGSVDGYAKSEFFVSGSEALDLIGEVRVLEAYSINDSQRVYVSASTGSDTLTVLESGTGYRVLEVGDSFTKLYLGETSSGKTVIGYVPNGSVTTQYEVITAVSIAEEAAAEEEAARIIAEQESIAASRLQASIEESIRQSSIAASKAEAASRWAATSTQATTQATSVSTSQSLMSGSEAAKYIPAGTSDLRRSIVLFALQYVGVLDYYCPGESLTSGADCSGFLKAVYAQFGISIPHYSLSIRYCGTRVVGGIDAAQPGDIICYNGHVAMYIGSGYIVHMPDWGRKCEVGWYQISSVTLICIQNVIGD